MVKVIANASVFPTEDGERVGRCLLNLFPEAELLEEGGRIVANTENLSRFKEIIRNHRILDSTRAVMLRGLSENGIVFQINKQAAFVGKVSFVEGNAPLGHIDVVISGEGLEAAIDDIAPGTINGEVP